MSAAAWARCPACRVLVSLAGLLDEGTCECGTVVTLLPISKIETPRNLETLERLGQRDFIKFP